MFCFKEDITSQKRNVSAPKYARSKDIGFNTEYHGSFNRNDKPFCLLLFMIFSRVIFLNPCAALAESRC